MLVRAFSRRESRYSCVTSSSSSSSESSVLCSDSDSEDEEKEDADELEDVDDLEEKFEGPSVSSESSGRNFPFPLCDIESAIGCCVTRGAEERAMKIGRSHGPGSPAQLPQLALLLQTQATTGNANRFPRIPDGAGALTSFHSPTHFHSLCTRRS